MRRQNALLGQTSKGQGANDRPADIPADLMEEIFEDAPDKHANDEVKSSANGVEYAVCYFIFHARSPDFCHLTLEFRATCGRRSLTLGRPWNNLLAQ